MKPDPRGTREFTIMDPACGTGGFLVCSYEWLKEITGGGAFDRELSKRIKDSTYYGQELVERPRRLALMNLYLHNLQPVIKLGDSIYEVPDSQRFDVILTNPPFGTKGANQSPGREDFTIETSNKQLNFIQHVMTILKPGGRAAVVVPDNVLFGEQAGDVFKVLCEDCDLHTVIRLPDGTFTPPYSPPGTKTNVIFFTKGLPTEHTWVYDCRTNIPSITKKDRPLNKEHFAEFEQCFGDNPNGRSPPRDPKDSPPSDRWHKFHITELKERNYKIDSLKWLRDDSLENTDDLPPLPEELAAEAIDELEAAVAELNAIIELMGGNGYAADE